MVAERRPEHATFEQFAVHLENGALVFRVGARVVGVVSEHQPQIGAAIAGEPVIGVADPLLFRLARAGIADHPDADWRACADARVRVEECVRVATHEREIGCANHKGFRRGARAEIGGGGDYQHAIGRDHEQRVVRGADQHGAVAGVHDVGVLGPADVDHVFPLTQEQRVVGDRRELDALGRADRKNAVGRANRQNVVGERREDGTIVGANGVKVPGVRLQAAHQDDMLSEAAGTGGRFV